MNRRRFLQLLGIAPVVPALWPAPDPSAWSAFPSFEEVAGPLPGKVVFAAYEPDRNVYAGTEHSLYRLNADDMKWEELPMGKYSLASWQEQ